MSGPFIPFSFLLASVLLGIVHFLIATSVKAMQIKDPRYLLSPRDDAKEVTGMAARLDRSYANFKETYIYFVVAMFLLLMLSDFVEVSIWAPITWIVARLLYIPAYAFGWIVRTPLWLAAFLGLIGCYIPLFTFFFMAMSQMQPQP